MNNEEIVELDAIADHLKPLTLQDFDVVYNYLKKYPSENCDLNICNLYGWNFSSNISYTMYCDRLIIFNPAHSALFCPVGERLTANELLKLSNGLKKITGEIEIVSIPDAYITSANLGEYFDITNDEDASNYVYTTDDLVHLTGKKLAKKKNLISQFHRLYTDVVLKPMSAEDKTEIIDFCLFWRKTHESGSQYLDKEFAALQTVLSYWDMFPCKGLKLYVNGKLCAFSIYSPQTPEMATVHYEKYDMEIKGAGQVINNETAKILINDYTYVNREEDLGLPGLRQAKHSYQPVKILPYYRLKAK